MPSYTAKDLAAAFDHSALRPELTVEEVKKTTTVGRDLGAASVCCRPTDLPVVAAILHGSATRVSTVIGFPHGCIPTEAKVAEAEWAMAQGCAELDMVLNIGRLRSGDLDFVQRDVAAVVAKAHANGAKVKVIFENAYLNDEQKVAACKLCTAAGADWVKTSTGFAPSGSTAADLALMKANVGPGVQVKAAGGVRTLDAALECLRLGVTRIGVTATEAILKEFAARTQETGGVLTLPDGPDAGQPSALTAGY